MELPHIEALFPSLKADGYDKSSEYDEAYNCFAFATSETTKRIDPSGDPDCVWPNDILQTPFLTSFIEYYRSKGFVICDNGDPEIGFEKIALYKNDVEYAMHAARLLPSGYWTSKIGDFEDIVHKKIESLEGYYGRVAKFMKRPIPS